MPQFLNDLIRVSLSLLDGFTVTLRIFALTLLIALPIGLILSFGSRSKITLLRRIVRIFIWIIRGTPLMLQLIVVFYAPGLIGNWAQDIHIDNAFLSLIVGWMATWHVPDRFSAVIISFVINYACYFSEIFRGGIESISVGQYEAGQVLGLTKVQTFFKVILLQVVKRIIPPMSNEIITLVKDTSLARTIMIYEVIWAAQEFIKVEGLLWPLFYSGVFYLAFCGILTLLFGFIEKKLNYFK